MTEQLSLLIITYNRPTDLLELLQSLAQQERLDLLNEVLVLNNASTVSYAEVEDYIRAHPELKVNYQISPENLGVSRGRNQLMQAAASPLLLVLDDDILFTGKDDLEKIAETFQKPAFQQAHSGAVTFRVIYHENKQVQKTALPHKQFDAYKDRPVFFTSYYTGCAHLLRREVLDKTGYYPTDFFYGMEEYDLAYRIINAGYAIGYDSAVTFEHKESPKGRQPHYQKLASQWLNKSKVAWRYLPKRYFVTTALAWSGQFLLHAGWHPGTFFRTWAAIVAIPFKEKRRRISKKAMEYLHIVKARLEY